MSLRLQAAADLLSIVSDVSGGFGWAIVLTNPQGVSVALAGYSADIGTSIDPETGMAITGRKASVALPLALLDAAGVGIPVAIADSAQKPWVVRFNDILGHPHTFKVQEAMPDRSAGIVTCTLEAYRQGV